DRDQEQTIWRYRQHSAFPLRPSVKLALRLGCHGCWASGYRDTADAPSTTSIVPVSTRHWSGDGSCPRDAASGEIVLALLFSSHVVRPRIPQAKSASDRTITSPSAAIVIASVMEWVKRSPPTALCAIRSPLARAS